MEKYLHIISLNIPWPPNYGGIIDIFYKIKALHNCGIKIILHCFEYERLPAPELTEFCEKVYYYKRQTGLLANFSLLPYNVYSRKAPELIENLLSDNYPILFEGLHSCYYLNDPRLNKRIKIFRACNIEHNYYKYLSSSCKNPVKKTFFILEGWKFKQYEKVIRHADIILAISMTEQKYLQTSYPDKKIVFIPPFHRNEEINIKTGKSDFILYHAKLSVFENERAALYLIKEVFSKLPYPCVIAGMDPSEKLLKAAQNFPNILIKENPPEEQMNKLIREAQINMLITFQDTGLKLKLLNSAFQGRHIIVNRMMLAGSGLDKLCHIADSPKEQIRLCYELMKENFDLEEIHNRDKILYPAFSNVANAQYLIRLIYEK